MDVLRLTNDTFEPDLLVEGYSSMIWTERQVTTGEFKLDTPLIEQTRNLLPVDSLISLRDTEEICVVENHSIGVDDDTGVHSLELTGRTYELNMETRVAIPSIDSTPNPWNAGPDSSAAAALYMMNYHLIQGTLSPNDIIRNLQILNLAGDTDTPVEYTIDPGDLYSKVIDMLNTGKVGIKNRRRSPDMPSGIFCQMIIYAGLDRSVEQTVNKQVAFSTDVGDINSASYLFSNKDYRNVAYVCSPIGAMVVYSPYNAADPTQVDPTTLTGRNRKVLYVDASDLTDSGDLSTDAVLTQRGLSELSKHNAKIIFDGEISKLSRYKYGLDYNLGDKITNLAEYGFSETMLVSEYVRTEDSSGESAYPTLVAIDADS